ncbi:MAG: hypothetical protein JNM93_10420 [Bacteriovoracaceae bacterium]|nr:hypothetical protein [Bacteriovoracaceae bacterium]
MINEVISIRGARVNNLKSVNVDIQLKKITCVSGVSGSGKTSLAFHTILNESKRRFLNSFPNYLKFFSDRPGAVDVDLIQPVLPVFGLPQINPIVGTRSYAIDVMGVTEILQNIFFHESKQLCPHHGIALIKTDTKRTLLALEKAKENDVIHFFLDKTAYLNVFTQGERPTRVWNEEKAEIVEFEEEQSIWEIGRAKFPKIEKMVELIEQKKLEQYSIYYINLSAKEKKLERIGFNAGLVCPHGDYGNEERYTLESFTPMNALGACTMCHGHGANLVYDQSKLVYIDRTVNEGAVKFLDYKPFSAVLTKFKASMKKNNYSLNTPLKDLPKEFWSFLYEGDASYQGFDKLFKYLERKKYKRHVRIYMRTIQKEEQCPRCVGTRLRRPILERYLVGQKNYQLQSILSFNVSELHELFVNEIFPTENDHAKRLIAKLKAILKVSLDLGLGHISMLRKTKTLSAGEYQRLLLLKYLSFEGTESLFVFDEPSIGLGQKQLTTLKENFKKLCEQGNTVIVVDHSEFFHKNCDDLIVMGPGAGKFGGEILYQGKPKPTFSESLPAMNLSKQKFKEFITVEGATFRGIKFDNFKIPLNAITFINGEPGTGKTSCIMETVANELYRQTFSESYYSEFGTFKKIKSDKKFDNIIIIDSQLNRFSSRSTIGSMTELFGIVRKHFLKTPEAIGLKLKDGHLSANSELGQCPECEGRGIKIIEMQFLEDIILECDSCGGKKIRPIYANIYDGKRTVSETYSLPISEYIDEYKLTPKFQRIWSYMKILKLDYLSLDRATQSLSGGEKQRIYLLSKLMKEVKNSIIFFENLTFGISSKEVLDIGNFLQNLLLLNNTIVILDQNTVVKSFANYHVRFEMGGKIHTIDS